MKTKFTLILFFIIYTSSQYVNAQELKARLGETSFDRESRKYYISYDILESNDNDLFLVEFFFIDYFDFEKIYPVKGSLSGDVGENAVRGGENKQFIWDFAMQPQQFLKQGEFVFDIIQLKQEVSKKLNRLFGRQNKIRIKLEQPDIRSSKRKRLTRKLDRINYRIKRRR